LYLNEFALDLAPRDMTASAEFASLLESAADLGIPHDTNVRYVSRHTVLRGLRFHFTEWGEPGSPAIVLLHGGNQSSHSWDLVSLHLADRYHVYALDQRGHGDTEWSREIDYSIDAMVQDVLAFLADQHLDRPVVFGHSMGGWNTMCAALAAPGFAAALVLVDVGPELSEKGRAVVRDFVVYNVEFDDLDVFLDDVVKYDPFRSREHVARTVKYNLLVRADGKYVTKSDHRRFIEGAMGTSSTVTLADVRAIDCPVLVLRGGESDVFSPEAALRFVHALPDARLVTVPAVGHNVHGGNTRGFLDAVAPFLSSLPRSPTRWES
jgi:pimeloyl-ACP methyl ester carboxylesterase